MEGTRRRSGSRTQSRGNGSSNGWLCLRTSGIWLSGLHEAVFPEELLRYSRESAGILPVRTMTVRHFCGKNRDRR
jgi:hypothetical protein